MREKERDAVTRQRESARERGREGERERKGDKRRCNTFASVRHA